MVVQNFCIVQGSDVYPQLNNCYILHQDSIKYFNVLDKCVIDFAFIQNII